MQLLENCSDGIRLVDLEFRVLYVNQAMTELSGISEEEHLRQQCFESLCGNHCGGGNCPVRMMKSTPQSTIMRVEKFVRGGRAVPCELKASPWRDSRGRVVGVLEAFRDLSDLAELEDELEISSHELRIQVEMVRQKSDALKEVLDQISSDKSSLGFHIRKQVEIAVLPQLKYLQSKCGPTEKRHLKLIRKALDEITSPFAQRLDAQKASLSARESEICNLIVQGMSTKEIAENLGTSPGTVEQQRKRIRKKLGISGCKSNLESYLRSLK